jgi:uncharacterized repeat protein (TIGR01451 family)
VQPSPAFGHSVSLSGDTVVVGAVTDKNPAGELTGAAYVFVRSGTTWSMQQKLLASDGLGSDGFGESVSISGDTVVVGSRLEPEPGKAYVFVRTGTAWTEQAKLVASDPESNDMFGTKVFLSGDVVVIGAPHHTTAAGERAGAAYVFVRSGTAWTELQRLVASDGAPWDAFGTAVSVSGDTAVVTAGYGDAPGVRDAGAAYVFVKSGATWTEQQKLVASDPAPIASFGTSAALSGDTAIVGAANYGDAFDPGAAYVFVRTGATWTEQQKLVASDGALGDGFGYRSVSVSGDTAIIGAIGDETAAAMDAGSAYVFVRSGTTWSEQQKLLGSGSRFALFGFAVSVSGDTVVAGEPGILPDGSAYVFVRSGTTWTQEAQLAEADLGVAKTDGQATAAPGEVLTYTITVSNAGPDAAIGASVTDPFPAELLGPAWICIASAGSTCTASGAGNINDTVNVALGGTLTYTVTGTVSPVASGRLTNTATVTPPGSDPNAGNNSATDVDLVVPSADLSIVKTDSADPVVQNDPLSYTVTIANNGPSDATGVTVTDTLPAGVRFVSSIPGPPTCTQAGGTLTCDLGALAAGANTTVSIDTIVNAIVGILVNTASVSASEPDPDPRNNTASEGTAVGPRKGELTHGTDASHDLAAQPGPAPDEDVFRITQKPYSSYEIVVDGTSGDIGTGTGPLLERIGPDGSTVLQASLPVGTGPSRSLRWSNTTAVEIEGDAVRVRSAVCGTDCGPDDVYRIRTYETTYSIPRFNNAGTQVTVLILQNPSDYAMSGEIYFRDSPGILVAVEPFSIAPKATLVLDTAIVPGANGISGSITIANDGRYGDLFGKTVALEPATGFSFDSPMVPRIR